VDTRFLETFIIVAERRSLAGAAQRLNLTPAAVAQRIKALEAEFGVKLLSRSGRVVRPTEAGYRILEKAKRLMLEARTLKDLATSDVIAGELRIGAINTALIGLLPDILKRLTEQYPRIAVFLRPGVSMDLYSEVQNGTLDASFVIAPRFPIPKALQFTRLREEPLVMIAPANLAGSDPLTLLQSQPFIRYDRSHWGGHLADEVLRRTGIAPIERYELDSLEAIAVMVDRGLGISIVPDWPPPWPAGVDIAKLPIPGAIAVRTIGIVSTPSSPKQHLIKALLDISSAAGA